MNVWSISASISVTSADILTQFGTEHKYHTINTPEWPNSHNLKIQDGWARHLKFRKNINNSGLDKDICTIFMWRCITATRRWPCDQKPKPEVNSSDVINVFSISVSISVTITDIWTKFGTEHKCHTVNRSVWPNSHNLKIQDGSCRHFEFRKMSYLESPTLICLFTTQLLWGYDDD